MVGVRGEDILPVRGAPAPIAARPTPTFCPLGGPSGPSVAGGADGRGGGGSSPPCGCGGPSFQHFRGDDDLKHTCDCFRCVVLYEMCIQSLMAQMKDLRAQNLELQRSQQDLFQAVAAIAGISQSYGDQGTKILSMLAKLDALVQGYQQDSRALAASVADHLKMSNSNRAKCFSAVEALTNVMPPLHQGLMRAKTGTPRLRTPLRWSRPCHRRLRPFLILSWRQLRPPWARHPVHPVVAVFFFSPTTHSTIASTIRTHVWTRGGQRGGRSTTNTPINRNPLRNRLVGARRTGL